MKNLIVLSFTFFLLSSLTSCASNRALNSKSNVKSKADTSNKKLGSEPRFDYRVSFSF